MDVGEPQFQVNTLKYNGTNERIDMLKKEALALIRTHKAQHHIYNYMKQWDGQPNTFVIMVEKAIIHYCMLSSITLSNGTANAIMSWIDNKFE